MEDRSTTGYAFKQDIEDTEITDDGVVRYDFSVYESLESAQMVQGDPGNPEEEIVRVKVTIAEVPYYETG